MKKILLSLILILMSFGSLGGIVHAATEKPITVIVTENIPGADCKPYNKTTTTSQDGGLGSTVETTTQTITSSQDGGLGSSIDTTTNGNGTTTITGIGADGNSTSRTETSVYTRKYECTITPGLAGFQKMLATIIKWFINIVMLCAVLAIVGLGIAWSFSGADDAKAKTGLKKWGVNIMMGLIILFFFRYILQFLAPWIYK